MAGHWAVESARQLTPANRDRHGADKKGVRNGEYVKRDRGFESGFLERGVTCELDFLDQGAELGYRVPDHGATRPVTVPRSGPSRVTAVANLLMTPIGLTLRPPRLLTSQSHFNRRYHGAYNDQLARNTTSR